MVWFLKLPKINPDEESKTDEEQIAQIFSGVGGVAAREAGLHAHAHKRLSLGRRLSVRAAAFSPLSPKRGERKPKEEEEDRRESLVEAMGQLAASVDEHEGIHGKIDAEGNHVMEKHHYRAVLLSSMGPILFFTLYILIGYFFYHNLEVDADGNPWTFIDCMYFAIVTCTSVGYGDLTPTRPGTKLFTCVYALVGIGLIGDMLLRVVAVIYRIQQAVQRRTTMFALKASMEFTARTEALMKHAAAEAATNAAKLNASATNAAGGVTRQMTNKALGAAQAAGGATHKTAVGAAIGKVGGKGIALGSAAVGGGLAVGKKGFDTGLAVGKKGLEGATAGFHAAQNLGSSAMGASKQLSDSIRGSKLYTLLMIIVPLVAYIFLGLALGHIEGWDFVTSIYVACISLATVGYGDFSPQSQYGRLFASFYIPTGVAVTLNVLAQVAIYCEKQKNSNKKVDITALSDIKLDSSGDGMITELEFTWYMLKSLKKVDGHMLEMIHSKFKTIAGEKKVVPIDRFVELDII
jgi:hypothetical protein